MSTCFRFKYVVRNLAGSTSSVPAFHVHSYVHRRGKEDNTKGKTTHNQQHKQWIAQV